MWYRILLQPRIPELCTGARLLIVSHVGSRGGRQVYLYVYRDASRHLVPGVQQADAVRTLTAEVQSVALLLRFSLANPRHQLCF